VGESGSGKSTSVLALLRLVPPPGHIVGGEVLLDEVDLLKLSEENMRQARGADISLIPQGAMNSLNPVMRIKNQMFDTMQAHDVKLGEDQLITRVHELLDRVGLSKQVADMYPHELSGGMKQRVCIANAISLLPKVIIADEPTSALDVVVQKHVMMTLMRLQEQLGSAVILIGHDIGLITQFADTLGVLYAGKLVEWARVEDVLDNPLHPYSRLLIDSLPSMEQKKALVGIRGMPPELLNLPPGCAFAPRCPYAFDRCRVDTPEIQAPGLGRQVACHLYPSHSSLPPMPEDAEELVIA
jgi:peptide/nickel transport system ATP-binding protein